MKIPQVGDCVGRYHLVEELGQGGMAVVYRAEDPSLGREVAIKLMHAHLWGKSEYNARFTREARAVASLRHPNIVEIFDFGEGEDDLPGYIISELLRGQTLGEYLRLRGNPLPEVAVMIALKLAQALECAHGQGIIHRDLKPENVIIDDGGRVVLTDFGIARIAEGEKVTQTGALVGSPAFMSPEQAQGKHIDVRSDLFSLGVVLYHLSTGQLPFSGPDPIAVVLKVLDCKYKPPLMLNSQIGGRLDRLIIKLLQKEPEDRYGAAPEVIADLRTILDEAGIEDVDSDLERYFEQPGPYNEGLISQIVARAITLARDASESQNFPRALSFCDRVLSFEPDNAQALELMNTISSRSAWRRWVMWLSLAFLLCGLSGAATYWLLTRAPTDEPVRVAPPPPADAGGGGARLDIQAESARSPLLADARGGDLERHRADGGQRRRRPATKTWRRAPRDLGRAPSGQPDLRLAAPGPDTRPAATHGQLLVKIGPHCEAFLDSEHVGRSPGLKLKVLPGKHVLVCRGPGGARMQQTIEIKAGEQKTIVGTVVPVIKVQLRLTRFDAVRISGKIYRRGFEIKPTRVRVDPIKGNRVVESQGQYVTFSRRTCTLVDSPVLICK